MQKRLVPLIYGKYSNLSEKWAEDTNKNSAELSKESQLFFGHDAASGSNYTFLDYTS